jgi:predicted NUDIX family NTP pyrophosphohydrolase
MSIQLSAGILLYRLQDGRIEVLLVHPGGPFWSKKDDGAWSIPKGQYEMAEDPLTVARREFYEETGSDVSGTLIPLTPLKQPSGKVIAAWAVEGDLDAGAIRSNTFSLEWPPKSGKNQEFPEVDRAGWYNLSLAAVKLLPGQRPFLDQLHQLLERDP